MLTKFTNQFGKKEGKAPGRMEEKERGRQKEGGKGILIKKEQQERKPVRRRFPDEGESMDQQEEP